MDKDSTSHSAVPDQAISPEEDAKLLAIEALEARSVDPNPRPLNAPREIPVPERPVAVPAASKVIEPVMPPKPVVQAPKPHVELKLNPLPTSSHTDEHPTPIHTKPVPKAPIPVPTPVTAPKPKKHATPSEAMAEELATAPSSYGFQFFANQKPPRKPFIIIGVIVVVIGIGAAAYFATR